MIPVQTTFRPARHLLAPSLELGLMICSIPLFNSMVIACMAASFPIVATLLRSAFRAWTSGVFCGLPPHEMTNPLGHDCYVPT